MKLLREVRQTKLLAAVGLLAIVVVLSGCQNPATTQATATPDTNLATVVTFSQANRCIEVINQSELGKQVFSQILYSPAIAREHVHLENSVQYLTDTQVELLKEFREKNKECRELRLQAFGEYELKVQLNVFYAEMDQLFDDLQKKRITIGQGNQRSKEIRARYQAEVRKFFDRSKEVDEDRVG